MSVENSIEELTSELGYIGEKLSEMSKCLKKMSNWTEADEEKYGDKEDGNEDSKD